MRRAAKWTAWALAVPATLLTLFLLAAWIGSAIPRNAGWTEPAVGIDIDLLFIDIKRHLTAHSTGDLDLGLGIGAEEHFIDLR